MSEDKQFDRVLQRAIKLNEVTAASTKKSPLKTTVAVTTVLGTSTAAGVGTGLGISGLVYSGLVTSIVVGGVTASAVIPVILPTIGIVAAATVVTVGTSILLYRSIMKGRKYRKIRRLTKSIDTLKAGAKSTALSGKQKQLVDDTISESKAIRKECKSDVNNKKQNIINRAISAVSYAISAPVLFIPKLLCSGITKAFSSVRTMFKRTPIVATATTA